MLIDRMQFADVVTGALEGLVAQEHGVHSSNRASVSVDDVTFKLRNDKGLYTSISQELSLFDVSERVECGPGPDREQLPPGHRDPGEQDTIKGGTIPAAP